MRKNVLSLAALLTACGDPAGGRDTTSGSGVATVGSGTESGSAATSDASGTSSTSNTSATNGTSGNETGKGQLGDGVFRSMSNAFYDSFGAKKKVADRINASKASTAR